MKTIKEWLSLKKAQFEIAPDSLGLKAIRLSDKRPVYLGMFAESPLGFGTVLKFCEDKIHVIISSSQLNKITLVAEIQLLEIQINNINLDYIFKV